MTRINTNTSSLNAQKTLTRNTEDLQKALTRLSTGLRINTGKDDPAGLIAAEILQNNIVAVQKAISNTQRGNQMIATADSALGSIGGLLHDVRSLVTEVANTAVMSDEQIAANQLQVDEALDAINRIAQVTKFQGRRMLDGSLDFITDANLIPQIQNLKIDRANLGATGTMPVMVEIAQAAEQAQITTSSGEQDAGTYVHLSSRAVMSFEGDAGGAVTGNIYIQATSLSERFENTKIVVNAGYDTGDLADYDGARARYDTTQNILYVDLENDISGVHVQNVMDAIDGTGLFKAYTDVADTTAATNTFESFAGTDNQVMLRPTINVWAANYGPDYNDVTIEFELDDTATEVSASYDSDAKTITVRLMADNTDNPFDGAGGLNNIGDIVDAIHGLDEFNAEITAGSLSNETEAWMFGGFAPDTRVYANTGATGYLKTAFSDATRAYANIDFAAGVTKTFTTDGADAQIYIKASGLGDRYDKVQVQFVGGGTAGQETAEWDAAAKSLVVNYDATNSTVDQILAAINATDAWEAVLASGSGTSKVDASQSSVVTSTDSLIVEAIEPGADFNNMQVVFESKMGHATPTATYDKATNTFTITVNHDMTAAGSTSLASLVGAINQVEGFAGYYNTASQGGVGRVFGGGVDALVVGNTGSSGGNALLDDIVFEVAGPQGMEVFTFNAGTTSNQMATAITQVADAIGVEATFNRDLVTILSTTYGQDSFVSFSVLSEGDKGQVGRSLSAFRAEGSDVEGTINGVQASSKGNAMWINTSTLALTIDVTPGMTDNFRFNINGGGAQFQLGPDVVTNQQVRMGIQSMNTARLGGVNGKLFELKTGGPADMRSDPNRAANILLDAINVVAELRGRLGAMQGFTMDTNIKTMEDTLENMIQAESQIRDADFAVETANLTRAQVLVQSGTTVLSIANQNPQNVLALLR